MSGGIFAQFEKRYSASVVISARLELPANEFSITVLFGPSGCGKTTILRSLAGLEQPESGTITFQEEIWLDARQSICRSPQQRDIGFCFQDYALFPHLTISQNIGYGLRAHADQRRRTVTEMLERFQLAGLDQRYPHQISGGQQQRVALARVLVRHPRLLLLDEPLSALDASLRDELRSKLRHLLSGYGIPIVLVTHERIEAIALADRVVVMDGGQIQQSGQVEEVFSKPLNSKVARIVGIETVETGDVIEVSDGLATVDVQGVRLVAVAPTELQRKVHVCIKGEDVTLQHGNPEMQSSRNDLKGIVTWITAEGPLMRVGIECGFELTALVTRPACEEMGLRVADRITATIKAPSIHLIPMRD